MTPRTGLSTLSRLPAELRVSIYENAVSNGAAPALMRTSRIIHNEIHPRLYDTLDIHFYPRKSDPWLRISFRRPSGASWCLWEEADCNRARRGLRHLPFHRFGLTRVILHAPDPNNLGQLAYLWLKVDCFVHHLMERRTPRFTELVTDFRPCKGHTWMTSAERQLEAARANWQRSTNPTTLEPCNIPMSSLSPRWDADFFWILFMRLYHHPAIAASQTIALSDGSTHELNALILDIQMYFGKALETSRGLEAQAIRSRVETMRVLRYVHKGGPWPWERPKTVAELLGMQGSRTAFEALPRVIRELLKPGETGGV